MARKKAAPKFTGELATPIVVPFDLDPTSEPKLSLAGLPERFRKLELLQQHYGVDNWMVLAYALATAFVPGFQIVYDDPLAAKIGLSTVGGSKSGRKERGNTLN